MEAVARKNFKRGTPRRTEIVACAKMVAVSESREIARVAYLGKIINIGSDRARKLEEESSREDRDISECDRARENGCRFRIARNRTGSIFRPNNEY